MMRRIIIFFCISLIIVVQAAAQNQRINYTVIPENPRPGEPVTIGVTGNIREAVLFADGTRLARAPFAAIPAEAGKPGFNAAVLTVPSTANPGPALIRLGNETGIVYEIHISIAEREFLSETIRITPSLNSLLTDPNPQRTEEAQRLWAILNTTGSVYYHTERFILPVVSTRRTSIFGSRRINRYPDGRTTTSIHAGIDFGIPAGTHVNASGAGRVVLARMRIVSGYSVIIEHGPGIYSLYYHLDKVEVQEGSIVRAGDLIGLSGSTGFSTGPHLHWELRVNGENTDPDAFVIRPIIDKDAIISNIFN